MRRQMVLLLTMALTAAGVAGCAQKGSEAAASKGPTSKVAAPGQHDKVWASKAYQMTLYQIEAGRLASSRATSDRVRNLARMMVRDYTDLGQQLETFARQHQLQLPAEMGDAHADLLQKLADVPNGPDFDRSYLNLELRTHRALIELFEDEANNGEFPGARAVAQDNLPELYGRLRHIQLLRPGTWSSPAKPTGDAPNPTEQPTTKATK